MSKTQKKTQKNFSKIPHAVLEKIKHLNGIDVKIASMLHLSVEDIHTGKYAHIGISYDDSNGVIFKSLIIPRAELGKYSERNVNGEMKKQKDLPMTETSFYVPNWGDWNKGEHLHSVPCYQKKYFTAKECPLAIVRQKELDNPGVTYCFMVSVDLVLSPSSESFSDDLLFALNLLQENIGQAEVVPSNMSVSDFYKRTKVNWEILPPGTREEDIAIITGLYKRTNSIIPGQLPERIDLLRSMVPREIVFGSSGFTRYIGAIYADDLVVFENPEYGNAIYILFDNWQEASKLSRTELLRDTGERFIRIVHGGDWKRKLREIVMKHLGRDPYSKAA